MLRYIVILFLSSVAAKYKYETRWFNVPLDHFGYQRNETFNIKYLVNDDNWDKNFGPIFIYTGNENNVVEDDLFNCGPLMDCLRISDRQDSHYMNTFQAQIEVFAQYTGFMWEIAAEFKAMVVFAEHRYYGASMPFGNKSLDNEHIGYLTTAQALADYAGLVNYLQGGSIHPRYPAIAFGGSYGGILAAYLRMKYPHIVSGAIASSAPVNMYLGMVPCDAHHRKVTASFRIASEKCVKNIRSSWPVLRKFLSSQNGREWLQKQWKLCDPLETPSDIRTLMTYFRNMYEALAMLNYPYASNFLRPLPAHPVKTVCQHLNETLAGRELLEGIGKVLEIFANYSGTSNCVEYKKGADGSISIEGWEYQKCTEMVMPRCSTGQEDMFEASPLNSTRYAEKCLRKYNVSPRKGVAWIQYGGDRLQAASNIVFSNGLLDPWSTGGILNNISDSVVAVVLEDVSHHLDLMPSNKLDPPSIKMARNIHKQNINRWIAEFRNQKKAKRRGPLLIENVIKMF